MAGLTQDPANTPTWQTTTHSSSHGSWLKHDGNLPFPTSLTATTTSFEIASKIVEHLPSTKDATSILLSKIGSTEATIIFTKTTVDSFTSTITSLNSTSVTNTTSAPEVANTWIAVPSPDQDDGSGDVPDGTTAAIVFGTLLAIGAIIYIAWCIQHRKRRRGQGKSVNFSPSSASSYGNGCLSLGDLGPGFNDDSHLTGLEAWLAQNTRDDVRLSDLEGMQSPSPQPATAEMQSFTRAQRKPRMCNIGQPVVPRRAPYPPPSARGSAPVSGRRPPTVALPRRDWGAHSTNFGWQPGMNRQWLGDNWNS